MMAIFFMKSNSIKSIPLTAGGSVSVHWYVINYFSQVFDIISQKREKTRLRGLIFHNDNAHDFTELR